MGFLLPVETMTHSNSNAFPPPSAATMTHSNVNNYPPLPQQQIQHPLSTAITNNYNNNNPVTSSSSPFHHLPSDCIHCILHYHIFCLQNGVQWREDIGPDDGYFKYDLELGGMIDVNWNFLRVFAHCCCYHGEKGLEEFLSSCRDGKCKPTFYYLYLEGISFEELYNNGAQVYLRGISELRLHVEEFEELPVPLNPLMRNIRGIEKLEIVNACGDKMTPVSADFMENLRGVKEVHFDSFDFTSLPDNAFENLRGITSLTVESCRFQPSFQIFTHLRGIQELNISYCRGLPTLLSWMDLKNIRGVKTFIITTGGVYISLTDRHLEHFRGVQHLDFRIGTHVSASLSDNGFKNLRGVRKVVLRGVNCPHVTDSAMVNLRGVEEIFLDKFPNLTSAAVENFRGIKKLTIEHCPKIDLKCENLVNLRGVQKLAVSSSDELNMSYDSLKNLCGVRSLSLTNLCIFDGGAVRHLREVRKLHLSSNEWCRLAFESGLHHLVNLEFLHLGGMNLVALGNFAGVLQLQNLCILEVCDCILSKDGIDVFQSMSRQGSSHVGPCEDYSLEKKHREWILY